MLLVPPSTMGHENSNADYRGGFPEPNSASENGTVSTLRQEGNNKCSMHSQKCAIIHAITRVPQCEWWAYTLEVGTSVSLRLMNYIDTNKGCNPLCFC